MTDTDTPPSPAGSAITDLRAQDGNTDAAFLAAKARLLPCPFCGGEAIGPEALHPLQGIDAQYSVACQCCACEGGWAKTPVGAVARWNERPALYEKKPSALVCSLADALGAAREQVAEAQEREVEAKLALTNERRENRERAERGRAALAQCEAERDALKKRLLLLDATDRSMGELLIEMEAERDEVLAALAELRAGHNGRAIRLMDGAALSDAGMGSR